MAFVFWFISVTQLGISHLLDTLVLLAGLWSLLMLDVFKFGNGIASYLCLCRQCLGVPILLTVTSEQVPTSNLKRSVISSFVLYGCLLFSLFNFLLVLMVVNCNLPENKSQSSPLSKMHYLFYIHMRTYILHKVTNEPRTTKAWRF
uniref:Heat shock induced transcript 2 n=2 Tax=Solanum lycopersicum TaxID=4081 RepID=Q96486_SOLLC|nr:heat shock induced transcript 2 [Solanum lycopersicum]